MPQNLRESSLVWIRPRALTKCQMILWKGFLRDKEEWRQNGRAGEREREIIVLE